MSTSNPIKPRPRSQSGAALVVSLILLSVLTILAISASQTSRMQERMAGNARNSDIAFQAAEAGVRNGEHYLEAVNNKPKECTATSCAVYSSAAGFPIDLSNQSDSWWGSGGYGKEYGVAATHEITSAVADPQYVIEYVNEIYDELSVGGTPGATPSKHYYRITSRAMGATDNAVAVVQTVYTRRFD